MISPEMEETTSDVDEEDSVCSWSAESGGQHSLLRKQRSESELVNAERRGVRLPLPFQPTAIEELLDDLISLVSIEPPDEAEFPASSQSGLFAEQCSDSPTSIITEIDLMPLPAANADVEEKNYSKGPTLRTMIFEADGIDNKEVGEKGGSSTTSYCSLFEADFSMSSTENNCTGDETGLISDPTKFLLRTNDSLLLLRRRRRSCRTCLGRICLGVSQERLEAFEVN
jgi:hypothetical protein